MWFSNGCTRGVYLGLHIAFILPLNRKPSAFAVHHHIITTAHNLMRTPTNDLAPPIFFVVIYKLPTQITVDVCAPFSGVWDYVCYDKKVNV